MRQRAGPPISMPDTMFSRIAWQPSMARAHASIPLSGASTYLWRIHRAGKPRPTAKDATSTIPIVFMSSDAVADGLVASLARPSGKLTGVAFLTAELNPKRFELLSELVPQARVIALLVNPINPSTERIIRAVQEAARAKGVQLDILKASTETEIDAAFAFGVAHRAGTLPAVTST